MCGSVWALIGKIQILNGIAPPDIKRREVPSVVERKKQISDHGHFVKFKLIAD